MDVQSKAELNRLYRMAKEYSGDEELVKCRWLYRNKPQDVFESLKRRNNTYADMKKYVKDSSGDQRSPINGVIEGLFFSASVESATNSNPRSKSAFGDTRLLVPVHYLARDANLYFTDFYCMQNPSHHYVTLVMTKPGSSADEFCEENLLEMDWDDNAFFERDETGKKCVYMVNSHERLLVEILYTHSIDLNNIFSNGGKLEYNVETFGKGKTSMFGLPKNTACSICNLKPTEKMPEIYERRKR